MHQEISAILPQYWGKMTSSVEHMFTVISQQIQMTGIVSPSSLCHKIAGQAFDSSF
jgi:hypothetical protein